MGESTHDTGESASHARSTVTPWIGGALGGVAGALVLGVLLWLAEPAIVEASIPALYGLDPTPVGGWVLHLLHGAIIGLVFAAVTERRIVRTYLEADVETQALRFAGAPLRTAGFGVVFGLAIWAVLPLIVMPLWIGMVGDPDVPVMPDLIVESLLGHLLYGAIVGAVYGAIVRR